MVVFTVYSSYVQQQPKNQYEKVLIMIEQIQFL